MSGDDFGDGHSHFCRHDVQHVCRNLSLILTAQRDQKSLTDCVAAFLQTLQLGAQLRIFERAEQGGMGGERLRCVYGDFRTDELISAAAITGAAACLQTGTPLQCPCEAGTRYLQPILDPPGITQIIVFDGPVLSDETKAFLTDLADLVGNLNHLHRRSERDGLTRLLNRQVFDREINYLLMELGHPERRSQRLLGGHFLALVDVDHFKRINDCHGHIYGDEVLLSLAQLMQRSFRHRDLLFRYGGEEFAVILNDLTDAQAEGALERLRLAVENSLFPQIGGISISIGYTELEAGPAGRMIERADKALYYCKHTGRNRVANFQRLAAAGLAADGTVASDIELF